MDRVDLQLVQDHDQVIDMLSEREWPGNRHAVGATAQVGRDQIRGLGMQPVPQPALTTDP